MTQAVRWGEVWAVDFEPQTHRQEPGKKERPALVIGSPEIAACFK
jgi:mRNA-degrading endonuclease toxin of MazEF toxin-antitoxin module